jgi:hypothetical protein
MELLIGTEVNELDMTTDCFLFFRHVCFTLTSTCTFCVQKPRICILEIALKFPPQVKARSYRNFLYSNNT